MGVSVSLILFAYILDSFPPVGLQAVGVFNLSYSILLCPLCFLSLGGLLSFDGR